MSIDEQKQIKTSTPYKKKKITKMLKSSMSRSPSVREGWKSGVNKSVQFMDDSRDENW